MIENPVTAPKPPPQGQVGRFLRHIQEKPSEAGPGGHTIGQGCDAGEMTIPEGSNYTHISQDLLTEFTKDIPSEDYFFDYLVDKGSIKGRKPLDRGNGCYVWF